jgi:hypothetical protein
VGGGDAIHPGPIGQTLMAWAVLKGLGSTAEVSYAEINAGTKSVIAARGCKIEHLERTAGGLLFDRLDEALPMPIDERAESALQLAPVLEDLDRYELRITGLSGDNFDVTIDGEAAGKVSAEQLAKGWNLANAPGPIRHQSREVLRLVFEKNNLFFHRWREIQLYGMPGWADGPEMEAKRAAEVARLDKQIADLEAQIDRTRKPKSRHFELKPATP